MIASTTCCCVVSLRLNSRDVLAEAQDRDRVGDLEDVVQVVRDEDDREALLAQAPDEVEHLPRLGHAERRGRLVEDHEREFHMTALATATDWRWPPERPATVWRTERIVVTESSLSVSWRARLHVSLVERARSPSISSRPRYMFWTTSRLSASARSW